MHHLTIWDLILTPVYLIVLSAIAKKQRDKRYPVGHPLRPYYMKGLYVKFLGAIFIALIYEYYYGGGDTYTYFETAKIINSSLGDSFTTWFKLLLRRPVDGNPDIYPYASLMAWYNDRSSYTVASIAAVFGLLNGTTYVPIALLFAYFSFTGIWAMYRTFVNIYPKLYKELAVAFFFIPSTFVWGSAIFKDTVCMFGLGWLTYTTFRTFVNKDLSFKNIFILILSFYLIAIIKLYILLAFIPALSLWLLLSNAHKLKSAGMRFLVGILFIGMTILGFFFFTKKYAQELDKYSLENVAQTAASTRGWISYASGDQGSAYDLGAFDPSIGGMLKKFPQAVVVTLFRPFLWEAKKVIVALSSLEALAFLYFTLRVFFGSGGKVLKLIIKDPNITFCLVFSIIFAFAVGISSYNFGALSRYKIPCLPFYAAFLIILYYQRKMNTSIKKVQVKSPKKTSAFA